MVNISVDKTYCKGCGLCMTVCPKSLIYIDSEIKTDYGCGLAQIKDGCIGCGSCYTVCPDMAIKLEVTQ